jgi:N-acetylglucosamine kinase-like BadF-type ATPase
LARKVTVISDVELAYLERLGRVPGLLILAGTGSIALARDDRGRWHRAGGLGPKLGDEGSGYWIGKEYRRRALGQESGTTPSDVRRVAAQTPVVFQRAAKKDPLCTAVIKDAVQHLAEIGRQAAHAAKLPTPWKIVWAGGLMDIPTFRRAVRRALAAREKRGHT